MGLQVLWSNADTLRTTELMLTEEHRTADEDMQPLFHPRPFASQIFSGDPEPLALERVRVVQVARRDELAEAPVARRRLEVVPCVLRQCR